MSKIILAYTYIYILFLKIEEIETVKYDKSKFARKRVKEYTITL